MPVTEERIQEVVDLNLATTAMFFDKGMRSSAWGSFFWGAICLVSGFITFRGSHIVGVANFIFAAFLLGEGIYEYRSRDPQTVRVCAITLGILAAWNLFWFVLAIKFNRSVGGILAHPFAIIFQAINAWTNWQSYAVFKFAKDNAKPEHIERTRTLIEQLKGVKAEATTDSATFKVSESFGDEHEWNLKFMPGLVFFVATKKGQVFKSGYADQVFWTLPEELNIEPLGEKWMSRKLKFNMKVGEIEFKKATIEPEMLQRLESLKASYSR